MIPHEIPSTPPSIEARPSTDHQEAPAPIFELRRSTRERRPPQRYGTFFTH